MMPQFWISIHVLIPFQKTKLNPLCFLFSKFPYEWKFILASQVKQIWILLCLHLLKWLTTLEVDAKKKKMFISHNKPESQWLSSSVLNGPSHCVWQIDARLTTYRRGPHWQCWEQWTLGHLLGMLQNKSIYFLFSFTQLVSCEMNYKMNRNPVDYSVYHNIIQNEYTG